MRFPDPRPCAGLAALQVRDHLGRGGAGTADWRRPRRRRWSGTGPRPGQRRPRGRLAGSGTGSVSVITMTYQRRCSRLSCSTLTVPRTGPVLADLDRADGLEGWRAPTRRSRTAVHFAPSPATNKTWLNRLVRLEPRIARLLPLPSCPPGRKNAANTVLSRRRVCCWAVNEWRPWPSGSARRMSLQLGGLHAVADADPPHAPRLAALLQRGVVQVAVIGQQPHRAALLGACRVGAELVSSSHRHQLPVFGDGNGPGGCHLAGPFARRSYGPAPTIPGWHLRGGSAASPPAGKLACPPRILDGPRRRGNLPAVAGRGRDARIADACRGAPRAEREHDYGSGARPDRRRSPRSGHRRGDPDRLQAGRDRAAAAPRTRRPGGDGGRVAHPGPGRACARGRPRPGHRGKGRPGRTPTTGGPTGSSRSG